MEDVINQKFSEEECNALNYIMSNIIKVNNFENLLKVKNPIVYRYIQYIDAPWIRKWLIEFAQTIKILSENAKNGIKLIDKLQTNFDEAVMLLYVSKCFFKSNCNIEYLIENKDPTVDIKINKDNKNEIVVECTEVKYSDQEKRINHTWNRLTTDILFTTTPVYYRGKLLKEFVSNRELLNLRDQLKKTEKEALHYGYSELINETIMIAYSKEENFEQLKEFEKKYKMVDINSKLKISIVRGQKVSIITAERIINTIKEKKKQIKNNELNILIVKSDNYFHGDLKYNSLKLEEFIKDINYLGILVIVGLFYSNISEKTITISDNIIFINNKGNERSHRVLIVKNEYSKNNELTKYWYKLLINSFQIDTLLL